MNKTILFSHGGSKNHGCEALVRSTISVLKAKNAVLVSSKVQQDEQFGLGSICNILPQYNIGNKPWSRLIFAFKSAFYNRVLCRRDLLFKYQNKHFIDSIDTGDICLSIGGDNYCYRGWEYLGECMRYAKEAGGKVVLWGCSVEPEELERNESMQRDIAGYDLITARETYSYEAIKKYNSNTVLAVDTAFFLEPEEVDLPGGFEPGNTVGINVSPMVQRLEKNDNIVLANYCRLIEWILENTQEKVALIPHVRWESNDDMIPLKELYEKYKDTGRVMLEERELNCCQLKYIISKCSCFVGARTHSTIAAYSSCVPTLVSGYSIKARGIAKDLFGSEEGYVVSVQGLAEETELVEAFRRIFEDRELIADYLNETMHAYKEKVNVAVQAIAKL